MGGARLLRPRPKPDRLCPEAVAARGGFPRTEAELRKLPGMGAYTAAAIAAIAFGERAVVIDTNVARVIARYHGIAQTLLEARGENPEAR